MVIPKSFTGVDVTTLFLCCLFRFSFKFWLFLLATTTSSTYWQFHYCCQFLMMSIWSQFYHLGLVRRLENPLLGLFVLCFSSYLLNLISFYSWKIHHSQTSSEKQNCEGARENCLIFNNSSHKLWDGQALCSRAFF